MSNQKKPQLSLLLEKLKELELVKNLSANLTQKQVAVIKTEISKITLKLKSL